MVGGEMVKVVRERTGIALVVGGRVGNGEACGVWCVHVHVMCMCTCMGVERWAVRRLCTQTFNDAPHCRSRRAHTAWRRPSSSRGAPRRGGRGEPRLGARPGAHARASRRRKGRRRCETGAEGREGDEK